MGATIISNEKGITVSHVNPSRCLDRTSGLRPTVVQAEFTRCKFIGLPRDVRRLQAACYACMHGRV